LASQEFNIRILDLERVGYGHLPKYYPAPLVAGKFPRLATD